jgi:hypothetical protein
MILGDDVGVAGDDDKFVATAFEVLFAGISWFIFVADNGKCVATTGAMAMDLFKAWLLFRLELATLLFTRTLELIVVPGVLLLVDNIECF